MSKFEYTTSKSVWNLPSLRLSVWDEGWFGISIFGGFFLYWHTADTESIIPHTKKTERADQINKIFSILLLNVTGKVERTETSHFFSRRSHNFVISFHWKGIV